MLFSSQSTRPDGIFRQWFSRLFYLAHSPFKITWYLDSHARVPTKRLAWALEEFERSDLDFVVASSRTDRFKCHNFNMMFSWNERVRTLFIDWLLRQLQRGVSVDDQLTLCNALACAGEKYGLKYGTISPSWAFAWLSLNRGKGNTWWKHRTTRVISGPAEICHSSEALLCEVSMKLNETEAMMPHIYYYDSEGGVKPKPVFSQKEFNEIVPYAYEYNWTTEEDLFTREKLQCKP